MIQDVVREAGLVVWPMDQPNLFDQSPLLWEAYPPYDDVVIVSEGKVDAA